MKCAFCNGNIFYKPIKVKSKINNNYVLYYKCKECNSIHQFPLPDKKTILDYYSSYSQIKESMNPGYLKDENYSNFTKERYKTLKEIGFSIDLFKQNSNVEIGCANGQFLQYLKDNEANNIIGLDISKELLDMINIKGIKKIHGNIESLKIKNIDNIFMFNILEHEPDVNNLIEKVSSKMNNNSKLIIEIPIAGIISYFFKIKWRFLMPYEHLHIPSLKGLKYFLNNYNLKIIGKTRFGSGFTIDSIPLIIKKSLDYLVKIFGIGDRGTFLCILK